MYEDTPVKKGAELLAWMSITFGMICVVLVEYLFISEPVPIDGPELTTWRVGSYFTLVGAVMVWGVTMLVLNALGRKALSFGVFLYSGVGLIGGMLGGAIAMFVCDSLAMYRIEVSHHDVPAAVRAYERAHNTLPLELSELVPDYLDELPDTPAHCTPMTMSFQQEQWALIVDCNVDRAPHEPNHIKYGHRDTVHRLIYKGTTAQWQSGSMSHHGCVDWPSSLRITPDTGVEGQVNF